MSRLPDSIVLTASDVKKLPIGTHVTWHEQTIDGKHKWTDCVVVQAGKGKALALGYRWGRETRPIIALKDHWFTLEVKKP